MSRQYSGPCPWPLEKEPRPRLRPSVAPPWEVIARDCCSLAVKATSGREDLRMVVRNNSWPSAWDTRSQNDDCGLIGCRESLEKRIKSTKEPMAFVEPINRVIDGGELVSYDFEFATKFGNRRGSFWSWQRVF